MTDRRLVLIRHAQTAEGHPDHERPLTARGRADAAELGRWLTANDVRPQRAVVSSAVRAQQTWTAIQAELDADAELVSDRRIYDNTVDVLREIIRETPDDTATLVLVGHNPAFGALARELSDEVEDVPTAAAAVFAVTDAWADFQNAALTSFTVARGTR